MEQMRMKNHSLICLVLILLLGLLLMNQILVQSSHLAGSCVEKPSFRPWEFGLSGDGNFSETLAGATECQTQDISILNCSGAMDGFGMMAALDVGPLQRRKHWRGDVSEDEASTWTSSSWSWSSNSASEDFIGDFTRPWDPSKEKMADGEIVGGDRIPFHYLASFLAGIFVITGLVIWGITALVPARDEQLSNLPTQPHSTVIPPPALGTFRRFYVYGAFSSAMAAVLFLIYFLYKKFNKKGQY